MQFREPSITLHSSPISYSNLTGTTVIKGFDKDPSIAIDLDPNTTTIGTINTIVADEIKANWRTLSRRVFRDTLPASAIILTFDNRELGPHETLAECGIKEDSEIETTIKRTEKDTELMQARARKGEEMNKQRNQRKTGIKRKARRTADAGADLQNQNAERGMEEAAAREAEEEDLMVIEERDEQDLEEARQVGSFRIGVEFPHEVVLEAVVEDPFDEEDADKENWDPQILRGVEGDRGGSRVL